MVAAMAFIRMGGRFLLKQHITGTDVFVTGSGLLSQWWPVSSLEDFYGLDESVCKGMGKHEWARS